MDKQDIIFFGGMGLWLLACLSLLGFGVWVVIKLMQHFGVI